MLITVQYYFTYLLLVQNTPTICIDLLYLMLKIVEFSDSLVIRFWNTYVHFQSFLFISAYQTVELVLWFIASFLYIYIYTPFDCMPDHTNIFNLELQPCRPAVSVMVSVYYSADIWCRPCICICSYFCYKPPYFLGNVSSWLFYSVCCKIPVYVYSKS